MQLATRLVVYEGDTFLDILPRPLSINAGVPLNDSPTIQFSYADVDSVQGSSYLDRLTDEQLDVALEVNWGEGWIEPPGCRYVIQDRQDDTSDAQHIYKFIGVGVDDDTRGVVVTDPTVYDSEGRRSFTSATPGQVLDTFHDYAVTNGMLTVLTNDFSVTQTSARDQVEPWNNTISFALSKETTYRTALDLLVSYGLINWRCEGNVLRVFNDSADGYPSEWGGMQRDKTLGNNPVELVMGRECVDGPQKITRRNLASDVWVLSDNNTGWVRSNANAYIRRGRRVQVLNQGGIASEGAAAVLGDKLLKSAESNREQLTRTLDFATAQYIPFRDYMPGDWVYGPGKANGRLEKLRVSQITIIQGADGVAGGAIILNDRLYERSIALQKQISALSNGAVVGGGGTATQPTPPGRTPAIPGDGTSVPDVSGDAYIDSSGHARATIKIVWPEVLSGVDGQAIDIDHYEVRLRKRKT